MKAFYFKTGRVLLTLSMVSLAGVAGWMVWDAHMNAPQTRDGKIRADIVSIAPDVSGFVEAVHCTDNQTVRTGDLLFSLDKARYRLALEQEEAAVRSAAAALDLAALDVERYTTLDDTSVSRQKREQVVFARLDAEAALQQAMARRDLARLNLERTDVRAPVNGSLSNFSLQPGTYVDEGVAVAAIVDTDSFYVAGYFEEHKLDRIRIGDGAVIRLMGSALRLTGTVEGIAQGIHDRERNDNPGTLANVEPTFTWVRLAQRVPVRIRLDETPPDLRLVAGRTVSVTVTPR